MNYTPQTAASAGGNLQLATCAAESTLEIFDRYANGIIGCYAHLYDTIEVHGVRNYAFSDDDATCYEIDNITPTSFSVYVRLKDGGLDCVGDFGKHDDAVQYSRELRAEYGWPVRNHVLDQHRTTTFSKLQ
jgi:hypothetical protein